jgi:hypothetical protein
VVAQIYGVGLITTRLSGLAFEIGIFVGLGGILVCSFLGGMRAVTWTQVAQYIILIVAYMIPVVWLSVKQTGVPIPQAIYGYQLQKVTEREKQLIDDPKEKEVVADLQGAGRRILPPPSSRTCRLRWWPRRPRREEGRRPEGRQRPGGRDPGRREGAGAVPKDEAAPRSRLDQGQGRQRGRAKPLGGMPRHARGSSRVTRTAMPRPEGLRRVAAQLPGAGLLPDGGHGRAAAHPDALLHHAVGEGGARVGDLVAVLHLPAVLHGAGAGGAGQVRDVQRAGGHAVRQAAGVDGAWTGSTRRCCRSPTSTRTASCSWRDEASAATSSCWPRPKSAACPT